MISIPTTCKPCVGLACLLALVAAFGVGHSMANDDARMSRDDAKKLKSPVPNNKESVARGKLLFSHDCTECHGADGKSQIDVVANATDLTVPALWTSGITEGEVYRSIRDGAGEAMPPFEKKYDKDEDFWHLVHFLQSLWPEAGRPKATD